MVADEVRALAERTTKATQEVSSIIQAIQDGTQDTVSRTEENCRLVQVGVSQSENAISALENIVRGSELTRYGEFDCDRCRRANRRDPRNRHRHSLSVIYLCSLCRVQRKVRNALLRWIAR